MPRQIKATFDFPQGITITMVKPGSHEVISMSLTIEETESLINDLSSKADWFRKLEKAAEAVKSTNKALEQIK